MRVINKDEWEREFKRKMFAVMREKRSRGEWNDVYLSQRCKKEFENESAMYS